MTAAAADTSSGAHGWRAAACALIACAALAHLACSTLQPGSTPMRATHGVGDLFAPMAALAPGYPLEEHFVTTGDGYILRVFRIPRGAEDASTRAAAGNSSDGDVESCPASPRPVAFMQHALLDSSAGWVLLGPGRALALRLADAGFDVWLANSRGNRYSRNHTRLDPDVDAAFWHFTWADMADHDVPAMVEHVAAATGQQRMVYFGYSQGSMIGLAALSSQPALAARVSLAILMAPVAFTRHMASPPFVISVRAGLDSRLEAAGWREWGAHRPAAAAAVAAACRWAPRACAAYLELICGANPHGNLEPATVAALMRHLPVGTSVRNMALWSQAVRRASATELLRYDFGSYCSRGSACNERAYGQATPPGFNLSAITTPLALFTGGRDTISPPADVALLKAALAPGVLAAHVTDPNYGHLDYEIGSDAPDRYYPLVIDLARRAAAGAGAAAAAA